MTLNHKDIKREMILSCENVLTMPCKRDAHYCINYDLICTKLLNEVIYTAHIRIKKSLMIKNALFFITFLPIQFFCKKVSKRNQKIIKPIKIIFNW